MLKIINIFKTNKSAVYFISAVFLIFLIPRLVGLGFDTYGYDSYYWDQRSDKFVEHLLSGNFAKTYRQYHPGVTTMYLAGFAKYFFQQAVYYKYGYKIRLIEGVVYSKWFYVNHFVSLFPIVVVLSVFLTLSVFLMSKLKINKFYLILFSSLLSISPFFLGISRFLHVTALETVFVFTFYTLYFYCLKTKVPKKFYILLGLVLALGLLSKISTVIVLPFVFLITLLFTITKKNKINYLFNKSLILSLIVIIGIIWCVILWPALWVNFTGTILKIYKDGLVNDAFDATPAPSLLKNKYLYYPEMLLTRSTGLTFITYIIGLFVILKEKNKTLKQFVLVNILFTFYYFFIMAFPDKKLDRYITNVFPATLAISSYVIYKIYNYASLIKPKLKLGVIFLTTVFFYYFVTLYAYYPSFSAIHSDLLGGLSGYSKIAKVKNRGEFYIEAVRFLNKKDGEKEASIKNLVVPNGGKNKSAVGYFGKIYTDAGLIKDGSVANYFLPDYLDKDEEIPTNRDCKLLKTFGTRFPFKFDYLFLYECK